MTDDIDAKIIQRFAAPIAGQLNEAAVIARLADGLGSPRLSQKRMAL